LTLLLAPDNLPLTTGSDPRRRPPRTDRAGGPNLSWPFWVATSFFFCLSLTFLRLYSIRHSVWTGGWGWIFSCARCSMAWFVGRASCGRG